MEGQEVAGEQAVPVVPKPGVGHGPDASSTMDAEVGLLIAPRRVRVAPASASANPDLGWAVADALHSVEGSSQREAGEIDSPKSPSRRNSRAREFLRRGGEQLLDEYYRDEAFLAVGLFVSLLACAAVIALVENMIVVIIVAATVACSCGLGGAGLAAKFAKFGRDYNQVRALIFGWHSLGAALLVAPGTLMATGSGASPPPFCHFYVPLV